MFIDQAVIAKRLGLSNNALKRILRAAKYDNEENYKLIKKKRCYEWNDVLKIIKNGKHGF